MRKWINVITIKYSWDSLPCQLHHDGCPGCVEDMSFIGKKSIIFPQCVHLVSASYFSHHSSSPSFTQTFFLTWTFFMTWWFLSCSDPILALARQKAKREIMEEKKMNTCGVGTRWNMGCEPLAFLLFVLFDCQLL